MPLNGQGETMMNQRTATVQACLAVLKDRGQQYELNGSVNIGDVLTEADKIKIRDVVFAGFKTGKIEMSEESKAKYSDDKALKGYVSGLVNNWIRKAPEFNNGSKYQAKNPGSRQGSSDEQIKEMKKLLGQATDAGTKALIQAAIDERQAEIVSASAPQIDVSKLPDHLKHLVKG
jgi:hypothetical protein